MTTMNEAIHRTMAAEIASLKSEIDWHCGERDRLRAEVAEYTKLKEYAKSLGQRTYLELHAENEHWKNEWKKLNVENKILRGENRILHAHSKRMRTACLMRAGYSISELEEMLAKATPPSPETEG